jgi:hypothetical protein
MKTKDKSILKMMAGQKSDLRRFLFFVLSVLFVVKKGVFYGPES